MERVAPTYRPKACAPAASPPYPATSPSRLGRRPSSSSSDLDSERAGGANSICKSHLAKLNERYRVFASHAFTAFARAYGRTCAEYGRPLFANSRGPWAHCRGAVSNSSSLAAPSPPARPPQPSRAAFFARIFVRRAVCGRAACDAVAVASAKNSRARSHRVMLGLGVKFEPRRRLRTLFVFRHPSPSSAIFVE